MPTPAKTTKNSVPTEYLILGCLALFPLAPFAGELGSQLTNLLIFALLALGLNVVVGYTGLLHLGIAAFFGIGAYVTGILTIQGYPFQTGFYLAAVAATLISGLAGLILGAPTLRLRGDYLALVTLGFGEVVRFSLRNLEAITGGTRGLNPIPAPSLPGLSQQVFISDYRPFFFLTLAILTLVVWLLRGLEHSRLGRAWVAIREDELAASCMGINVTRAKLMAFAVGSALAGLAGCLYATKLSTTASPDAYDFNRSIMMLCCIILGGLGSIRGTLIGVLI
ncbi:MAG TPA: branched-chain amino acid ABC transporter permease, partial [Pirellulaceae bacterium]|nr:branched-chain amino acid ABC transporter permease [Pirellulaceae bacterium]